MIFEWYRDADKLYRARLCTEKRRIIAIGEGYCSRSDCMSAIATVQTVNADTPIVFVEKESSWPRKRSKRNAI